MYDKNEILYMQINVFFTKGSINTKLKKKKKNVLAVVSWLTLS